MENFTLWFGTGVGHILDLQGADHILFVVLLVVASPAGSWKNLLGLITAFTLGHSVSLALSAKGLLNFPSHIIELLIALTILFTSIYHLATLRNNVGKNFRIVFSIVVLFGLIHGLGFSFLLKSMLGEEQNVLLPLLWFNLGLELGQIIVITAVLLIQLFVTSSLKYSFSVYKITTVCFITLFAAKLSAERLLELF